MVILKSYEKENSWIFLINVFNVRLTGKKNYTTHIKKKENTYVKISLAMSICFV